MKRIVLKHPVRTALSLTASSALAAVLGAGSAWAMTPPLAPSAAHATAPARSGHALILAQANESQGEEMEKKGIEEEKKGIEEEQKAVQVEKQGVEDQEKGAQEDQKEEEK